MHMRLYFHLVDGTATIPDEAGIEVANLDAAKAEALSTIREMRAEHGTEPRDWASWRLVVADASGDVLFSLDVATA
jgi:hypothetical protein